MIETINLADGCSFSGKDGVDFTFIWIHFVKIDAAALGMDETSPRGLVLRVQNGGLTTQHDTEERRESCLISPIFDRNFSLQRGKSFNFISFYVFFHVPR